MSPTTELAELHDLIGGLRRCVSSLKARYGDSPALRRIVIDADRILGSNPAKRSPFQTPSTTANFGAMSMTRVSGATVGPDNSSPPGIRGLSLCTLSTNSPFEEEHLMSAPTANRPASGVFSPTRAHIQQRTLRTDPKYHYLTPFYSPCLSKACGEASDFWPQILPNVWWLPFAALSLPFLLLFRLTCYYYRGAYYRTVWQSPTACAVAEPRVHYTGETRFPLIVQNTHRYFFYVAGIISVINSYDAIVAFHSEDGPGGFGFGLGNVILVGNVIMLWVYTLSCHSCRHVTGGRLKHFSKPPVRYWIWTQVSKLNTRHKLYAWITLGTLMLTDFYIALVSSGTIPDLRFIG